MFGLTRTVAIVLAGLLITAGSAAISSMASPSSAPEEVGLSSERLARMNKAIHEYVGAGRTPGVVTLIARHGKVVHVGRAWQELYATHRWRFPDSSEFRDTVIPVDCGFIGVRLKPDATSRSGRSRTPPLQRRD